MATREIGHALKASGGYIDDNPTLRFPQRNKIFDKMGREDSQIITVLRAVRLPIQHATWRIDPNGADSEVVEHVASDLRLPILGDDGKDKIVGRSRGRVSWAEHLQMVLLSLVFGHMFFEQVYEVREDGREHLRKLAPRHPLSIRAINVARDGGLESIEQNPVQGERKPVVIPVDRLVAYVHDPWDTSWQGTSVLRGVYLNYVLRNRLLRDEVNAVHRNSMGIPIYTGSAFASNPNLDLENGREIAKALCSGEDVGAAIPDGAKLDLVGVSGQLISPRSAIEYHDSAIARALLAHFLNLEGKGGSYALADTQAGLFVQSLQTIAEWIAEVATQHVVEDLVDVAFPDYVGSCPRITLDPIASKKEITADALAALVNAGIIYTDRPLEEEIRRRYTLPAKPAVDV